MSGFFASVWSFITTIFWLAFLILIALGVIAFFGYNRLRQLSEGVKESWSNVTVAQRKQVSLINQLLDVVKGYQESEKLVMLKVADNTSNAAVVAQMHEQSGAVMSAVAGVAQRFPELKANQQYQRLIDSIQGTERDLEQARQHFNQCVKEYNVQRSMIPHVFYSAALGFRAMGYLEFSGADQVSDMGVIKSFSSDDDGERLNQLLSNAGSKAIVLGGKALEGGRQLTSKAFESGKVLAESAQVKFKDLGEKNTATHAPPPPVPAAVKAPLFYYLDKDNKPKGPVEKGEIRELVTNGDLEASVLIAEVGSTEWVAMRT